MNRKLQAVLLLQFVIVCSCTLEKKLEPSVLKIAVTEVAVSEARPHPMLSENGVVVPVLVELKNSASKPVELNFASLTGVILRAEFRDDDGRIWKFCPAVSPHYRSAKVTAKPDTTEAVRLLLATMSPPLERVERDGPSDMPTRLRFEISDSVYLYQGPRNSHKSEAIKIIGQGYTRVK